MRKHITKVKEINNLIRQDNLDFAKQKLTELKKLFPNDDAVNFLNQFFDTIFLKKEKTINWGIDAQEFVERHFYLYHLLKDTYLIDNLKKGNILPIRFWDMPPIKIKIQNYFSIQNIELDNLSSKKEIYFLGENGDGKTILLQSILLALKGNTGNETVFSYLNQNDKFQENNNELKLSAHMLFDELIFNKNHKEQDGGFDNIFAYGVNRLRKSDKNPDKEGYLTLFDADTYLTSPEQWLKDTQLDYLTYQKKQSENKLTDKDFEPISPEQAVSLLEQIINFEEESKDKKFKIIINGTEIKFIEKGTELEFEQLSDGYKSILILLSDLISHLSKNRPFIESLEHYTGIVIIDELGVFLHPKWEFTLARNLRKLFPNIQWIFSTHSPIAILGASKDAVFYKVYKKNGTTEISKPFTPEMFSDRLINGFLTSSLFNMPTAKPAAFQYKDTDFETGEHIYGIIHKEVHKRLDREPLQNDEIKEMVSNLLDKFEKTGK